MRQIATLLILAISGCVTVETTNNTSENTFNPKERAEARIALGMGYLEQGNMLKARENFEKALNHSPGYYRAQLSMAHYFEKVGETSSAEKMYKTSLRQHPKNGNVLNNYGTFLCKQGDYSAADKYFNSAIQQPYYYLISGSYENAALCALKAGNTQQAKNYFIRTLDHDPNRINSVLRLAKLEIDDGEYTQARIRLMKLHQSYGLQKPSLRLLIELEEKAGNHILEQQYRDKLAKLS
tara:strand:- start:4056 stop:4769 length:714 start_codon:yes stop_codon:yes gene_type:complete